MVFALDAFQRRFQSFNQFSARRIFDDGEPVVAYPVGVGLNLSVVEHFVLPKLYPTLFRVFGANDSAPFSGWGAICDCGGQTDGRVFQKLTTRSAVDGIRRV